MSLQDALVWVSARGRLAWLATAWMAAGLLSTLPSVGSALDRRSALEGRPAVTGAVRRLPVTAILSQNLRAGVRLSAGVLTGGIGTVLQLAAVGRDVGEGIAAGLRAGLRPRQVAAALLPHAVVELPAFGLTGMGGMGLTLGLGLLVANHQRAAAVTRQSALTSLAGFALLVVAAVLESFVTSLVFARSL